MTSITSALSSLQNYLPSENSIQTAVIYTVVVLVGGAAYKRFQNARQPQGQPQQQAPRQVQRQPQRQARVIDFSNYSGDIIRVTQDGQSRLQRNPMMAKMLQKLNHSEWECYNREHDTKLTYDEFQRQKAKFIKDNFS